MSLLGLLSNNGFIPSPGPDMPVDVHSLAPMPRRFTQSAVGRAYARGGDPQVDPSGDSRG